MSPDRAGQRATAQRSSATCWDASIPPGNRAGGCSTSCVWWRRALRVGYHIRRFTGRYVLASLRALRAREILQADLTIHPAQPGLSLDRSRRGRGVDQRLLDASLEQLHQQGAPGVHLHTTSLNRAACRLYECNRFRLLDERPTRIGRGLVGRLLANRCYGLRRRDAPESLRPPSTHGPETTSGWSPRGRGTGP